MNIFGKCLYFGKWILENVFISCLCDFWRPSMSNMVKDVNRDGVIRGMYVHYGHGSAIPTWMVY